MGAEKLDQNQMVVEAGGIKGFAVAIGGGKVRNRVSHLNALGGIKGLGTDKDSEQEKATYQHAENRREGTGITRASDKCENTQANCGDPCNDKPGTAIGKSDRACQAEPQHCRTQREGQCRNTYFGSCFHTP